MFKTEAASKMIHEINPDVVTEAYTYNLTQIDKFADFSSRLRTGSLTGGPVDLVLGCVDNFGARIAINSACCELGLNWFESGVSEDAMGGHIQFIVPGATACFECVPPLIVASGVPESTLKREGVCAASLPTTMGLVSALLVQNALKYLLRFGKVSFFAGYSAITDFFPAYSMGPNNECGNSHCRSLQAIWRHQTSSKLQQLGLSTDLAHDTGSSILSIIEKGFDFRILLEDTQVVHEDNQFGITLMESSDPSTVSQPNTTDLGRENEVQTSALPTGLSFSFEQKRGTSSEIPTLPKEAPTQKDALKSSLASLREKLRTSQQQ